GLLVKARLDHAAKEAMGLAQADQGVARDVVAGVRVRIVVGPGAPAQVRERGVRALAPDDHVGEVDGLAPIPRALEHRSGELPDWRCDVLVALMALAVLAATCELDVGQAADEANIDRATGEIRE